MALGAGFLLWPLGTLFIGSGVFFTVFALLMGWRAVQIVIGVFAQALRLIRHRAIPRGRAGLPVYTVLVALYDEAAIMPQLAAALRGIDWPADKIDVILLLEKDDLSTQRAAQENIFPARTRIAIVPDFGPKTKPRALNHGFSLAEGQLICVFDAEDRPDPDQLRKAFAAFERGGAKCACVQAALIGDNSKAGWIAAQWSLEYAVQFGLLLPAQAGLRLPIALGGTSNHFRKDALEAVGAWDAWNVTEDADLGLRFARFGYRVSIFASKTLEDAPVRFLDWYRQRSRWIKGFIQTWLVVMRHPKQVISEIGIARFFALQLNLGGAILAPLLHGPVFVLVILSWVSDGLAISAFAEGLFVAGILIIVAGDILAPGKWSLSRLEAIATRPLYWPLHSLAAFKALIELAYRPQFWAKTPHLPRHGDPKGDSAHVDRLDHNAERGDLRRRNGLLRA